MIAFRKRLAERAGALALLILLIATIWLGAIDPVVTAIVDRLQEREDAHRLAEGFARKIAAGEALEQRRAMLQAASSSATDRFAGSSLAAIAAAIQTQTRQLFESHGGQINSITLVQPTGQNDAGRMTISLDARLPGDRLADLLTALAQTRPSLSVTRLDIRNQYLPGLSNAPRTSVGFLQIAGEVVGIVQDAKP